VKQTGIILKQFSGKQKVALFDKKEGRLDAVVRKPLLVGSLIDYTIEKRQGALVYLDNYALIDLPFQLAREDLLFWHHVLELCYYFVPVGSYTDHLFELCSVLYTTDATPYRFARVKKIYLFKLLTTIGLYPRLPELSLATMHHFMALDLHAMAHESINDEHEQLLDRWLRLCITQHPAVAQFKTINYLIAKQANHE